MKIRFSVIFLFLCPVFLTCLWATDTSALTCLAQTKTVIVDADWQVTGTYCHEFAVSTPDDAVAIHHLIQQRSTRPDPAASYSAVVRLTDGREIPWSAMDKDNPPLGGSVKITVAISKIFSGFEGLFADRMHINQNAPAAKTDYHIRFPEKTHFMWQIRSDHPSNNAVQRNTSFSDGFSWSGNDIRHLDLKISTAASWDAIKDRYQTNFQSRITSRETAAAWLPALLPDIRPNSPDNEKINHVMNFIRTGFDYQRHSGNGHGLLPDDPAAVIDRGWGDCKDMTLIAALLLQSMGIDAFVVLEGNPAADFIGATIPDPFIFDHAMVGTCANGQVAYYDCFSPENPVAANDENIYLHLKVSHDSQ